MADAILPMTDEELTDLARRYVTREIWISGNVDHWMILRLAEPEQIPENLGLCWQEMSKASPMALNGQPIFLSCHLIAIEDCERLETEVKRMLEALRITADA